MKGTGDVDGEDFAVWYRAKRDDMARSLLVIGGDAEAAGDAVAEAFSRAYERWSRVRAMHSPAGWVYRVALNELRRRMRRRAMESRLLGRDRPSVVPPPRRPIRSCGLRSRPCHPANVRRSCCAMSLT